MSDLNQAFETVESHDVKPEVVCLTGAPDQQQRTLVDLKQWDAEHKAIELAVARNQGGLAIHLRAPKNPYCAGHPLGDPMAQAWLEGLVTAHIRGLKEEAEYRAAVERFEKAKAQAKPSAADPKIITA